MPMSDVLLLILLFKNVERSENINAFVVAFDFKKKGF